MKKKVYILKVTNYNKVIFVNELFLKDYEEKSGVEDLFFRELIRC